MATINGKIEIEGVDVLGVVTAGETIYVGRATSTQHGIVKPAATDFDFDADTNAMQVKLGKGLERTEGGIAIIPGSSGGLGDIYGIQFPVGGADRVLCDGTNGITITGTVRLFTNEERTATLDVPDSTIILPIVTAEDGLRIDASVDQKKSVLSAAGITAKINNINDRLSNIEVSVMKI